MSFDDETEVAHGRRREEAPGQGAEVFSSSDPNLGRRIGPYRVERLLARGGMGMVYLAGREDDYQQLVALKLIQPERLSVRGLDRFYRERQILARLQHPNVAGLLDGGSTDQVLPYLVMEYVEGEPIDRYCDRQELSINQRLALFGNLCEAVHFAHKNLVVHRDLKPSNVLVTASGTVKLLDFGIAKLLDDTPPDGKRSAPGQQPMTPTYASPEQLAGQTVTTASDIYSLGVLLCKLLTGYLPYERQRGVAQRIEVLGQAEPKKPSALVRDKVRRRRLAGDLDAIILKALCREPEQRYASALQLAEDLRRHRASLPVEAYAGSLAYRARKLVRRNKLGVALALTILVFGLTSTVLWRRAVDQKERAESSLRRSEQVSTLLKSLFRNADPNIAQGSAPTIRQALDRSRADLLGGELATDPELRAELLGTLGSVYNDLGLFTDARQLKEEALRIRQATDPSDRVDLAGDLNNLGRLLYDLGDHAAAEERFRQAVAMWRRLDDDEGVAIGLRNQAAAVMYQERYDEALRYHHEVLEIQRRLHGPQHPEVAASLYSQATLHRLQGEFERAEPLLRGALAVTLRTHGPDHTRVASMKSSLGRLLHLRSRDSPTSPRIDAEARKLYEEALDVRSRLLGERHERTAVSRRLLAELLLDAGETEAAGELLEVALDILRQKGDDGDWKIAVAESVWGRYLAELGRCAEAEQYLLTSYHQLRETKGAQDANTRDAERRLYALDATCEHGETAATSHAAAVTTVTD